MVDELRIWPIPGAPKIFHKGSCHLTASTLEELHEFAARIGLRRAWFQHHRILSHYDLTPARRKAALAAGAIEVPMRVQLVALRLKRKENV